MKLFVFLSMSTLSFRLLAMSYDINIPISADRLECRPTYDSKSELILQWDSINSFTRYTHPNQLISTNTSCEMIQNLELKALENGGVLAATITLSSHQIKAPNRYGAIELEKVTVVLSGITFTSETATEI